MKKHIIILCCIATISLISSCSSVKVIGKVNVISNRSLEPNATYTLLRANEGELSGIDSRKKKKRIREIKKERSQTIDAALDRTIRNTAGGQFLKNVSIFKKGKYYAVEGDVWGIAENQNIKGWKVGDKVQWKSIGKTLTGVITDLKDANTASVKQDKDGKVKNVAYDKLTKIE